MKSFFRFKTIKQTKNCKSFFKSHYLKEKKTYGKNNLERKKCNLYRETKDLNFPVLSGQRFHSARSCQ